ncbi:MAG: YbaK/EbsC family protein [Candidatus Altiarchaeota archaeon]
MHGKENENKLKKYIKEKDIKCEYLTFQEACHSVDDAVKISKYSKENIVKSICLIDENKNFIVAIVSGNDKVSLKKVANFLNNKVKMASPIDVLKYSTYPIGGVPPFGYSAKFLIDKRIMEKEYLIAGGGSEKALIKISPKEMQKANNGEILDIREE